MKQFKMLRNKQIYNLQQLRVHWYSEKETNIQFITLRSTAKTKGALQFYIGFANMPQFLNVCNMEKNEGLLKTKKYSIKW